MSACARQDTVNYPVHIKNFNLAQLRTLCKELRSDIIHTVSKTGGARTLPYPPRPLGPSPRAPCLEPEVHMRSTRNWRPVMRYKF